jgi:hypothetical protein
VVDIYGVVRPLEAGILQTSPLHKNLNISTRRRCADKPSGYSESSGLALSAHPLGLSARLIVIEIFGFLCGGRHLRCRQTPGGWDPTDFTTTQKPEYLHAQAMRQQAKWIGLIIKTGAFSASTWFVGASRCNGDIQLFVVLWTSATTTQQFGHNSMRRRCANKTSGCAESACLND